jgi:hypothetical protein
MKATCAAPTKLGCRLPDVQLAQERAVAQQVNINHCKHTCMQQIRHKAAWHGMQAAACFCPTFPQPGSPTWPAMRVLIVQQGGRCTSSATFEVDGFEQALRLPVVLQVIRHCGWATVLKLGVHSRLANNSLFALFVRWREWPHVRPTVTVVVAEALLLLEAGEPAAWARVPRVSKHRSCSGLGGVNL